MNRRDAITRDQLLQEVRRALEKAEPASADERMRALEARLPPGDPERDDDPFHLDLPTDDLAHAVKTAVEDSFPDRAKWILSSLGKRLLPDPESVEIFARLAATTDWSGVKAAHVLARIGDARAIPALLRECAVPHPSRVLPAVASLCLLVRRGGRRIPEESLRSLVGLKLVVEVYEDDTEPGSMWDTSRLVGTEPVDVTRLERLVSEALASR